MRCKPATCRALNRTALSRAARLGRASAQNLQRLERLSVVTASHRLVLTPTGTGDCSHIGEKVALPPPIELKDGVFEVGRSEPADIVLRIPTVSSRHALLRVEDDKLFATDLNSTNGTVVNGQELTPLDNVEISVGSEIVFGDQYLAKFQLRQLEEERPPPTVAEVAALEPPDPFSAAAPQAFGGQWQWGPA